MKTSRNLKKCVSRTAGLSTIRDALVVVGELARVLEQLGGGLGGQQRGQVGRVRAGDHEREQPPAARHRARAVRSGNASDEIKLLTTLNL